MSAASPASVPKAELRQRRSMTAAVIGAVIVLLVVIGAVFAPLLAQYDPGALSDNSFMPPSLTHPMGTDDLGRDMFARVLYGGRVSLVIGLSSAVVAVIAGTLIGTVAGFFGGFVDELLMRTTELFQVIPRFLLAIVVISLFGTGSLRLVLVIGLLSWPATARIMRAQVLVMREEEFVLSARMSGATAGRIIFRHVLPNVLPYLLVSVTLQTGSAILVESFLSFLGLGDASLPSWGLLLQQGQIYLRTAWWMSTFPGIALSATILGLNLVSDGVEGKFVVKPRD